jgi:hypothetical protein
VRWKIRVFFTEEKQMQTQFSTANPDLASLLITGYLMEAPPPPDPIDPPDNQGGGGTGTGGLAPKTDPPEEQTEDSPRFTRKSCKSWINVVAALVRSSITRSHR